MLRFAISALIVLSAGALQLNNAGIYNVTPNWVLAVLLPLSILNKDWLIRANLILLALIITNFYPYITAFSALFAVSTAAAIFLIDHLPYSTPINIIFAVVVAAVSLNYKDLVEFNMLLETLYNTFIAITTYLLVLQFKVNPQNNDKQKKV